MPNELAVRIATNVRNHQAIHCSETRSVGEQIDLAAELIDSELEPVRKALQKIADESNWCNYDGSGCAKSGDESWRGEIHAMEVARQALSLLGESK